MIKQLCIAALSSFILATSASAQETPNTEWIEGTARVIDGDSLLVDDQLVRLFGIDAPEQKQTCYIGNLVQACGEKSTTYLADMVHGKTIRCRVEKRDAFERVIANCIWNGRNINEVMVLAGQAIAWPRHSEIYLPTQNQAKAEKTGIWQTDFISPGEWRKANDRNRSQKDSFTPRHPTPGFGRKVPVHTVN